MIKYTIILLLSLFAGDFNGSNTPMNVKVKISGMKKLKGSVRIAIYSVENEFLSEEDILDFRIVPVDESIEYCTFKVEKEGRYAMALVHDLNDNGKMDYSFVGWPTEPYAFSNNPGIWYRAPTFEECAVEINGDRQLEILLK